jgi:CDP-diacylglycerol---serine O-phosphatidyltransferase
MIARRNPFEQLPMIALAPDNFNVLLSAQTFRSHFIQAIRNATKRIYIVALYLEDDEAGREILTELYEAKQRNPELDVAVCVDWHRAQRGLIGASASEGNAAMYHAFAEAHQQRIPVYGIPVRGREVFGVLHLKGFVVDDEVIYSGASLNNVYLHFSDKYRFDRYHTIISSELADSMVKFISENLIAHPAVHDLTSDFKPTTKSIRADIRQFRSRLALVAYEFDEQTLKEDQIGITPLVGLGRRRNNLNRQITQLIAQAEEEIFICTPYFNFPATIYRQVKRALRRGVKIHIVVGDKTANDFYIAPEADFKAIGGLPYLYELNLRKFAKAYESRIASRQLSIHLWKHDNHSFHLKGLWIDKKYMLITGNNLNPRAWKLDLENGLLVHDPKQQLVEKFTLEVDNILKHTQLICTYKQIEKLDSYPTAAQNLLRKIVRVKADRILKQIL